MHKIKIPQWARDRRYPSGVDAIPFKGGAQPELSVVVGEAPALSQGFGDAGDRGILSRLSRLLGRLLLRGWCGSPCGFVQRLFELLVSQRPKFFEQGCQTSPGVCPNQFPQKCPAF
jgi:hypothetical protein